MPGQAEREGRLRLPPQFTPKPLYEEALRRVQIVRRKGKMKQYAAHGPLTKQGHGRSLPPDLQMLLKRSSIPHCDAGNAFKCTVIGPNAVVPFSQSQSDERHVAGISRADQRFSFGQIRSESGRRDNGHMLHEQTHEQVYFGRLQTGMPQELLAMAVNFLLRVFG